MHQANLLLGNGARKATCASGLWRLVFRGCVDRSKFKSPSYFAEGGEMRRVLATAGDGSGSFVCSVSGFCCGSSSGQGPPTFSNRKVRCPQFAYNSDKDVVFFSPRPLLSDIPRM